MFSITKDYSFPKKLADNLKKRYESNKRIGGEPVHVSDLVPSSCIRKHYYERKSTTQTVFSDDDVFRFIRGESSERVITELADIGAAQVKIMNNGITARPDILRRGGTVPADDYLVIELKDNATLGSALNLAMRYSPDICISYFTIW